MNMNNKNYIVFETIAGWIGIACSSEGICRTSLPENSFNYALRYLNLDDTFIESNNDLFIDLVSNFRKYFQGKPVDFRAHLDFSRVTAFQKAVYQAALTIPFGETRSYGWIANKIGKTQAARAVGQALHYNPFPILVPCHRVLPAGGGPGGFAGGTQLKQFLLKLEASRD